MELLFPCRRLDNKLCGQFHFEMNERFR